MNNNIGDYELFIRHIGSSDSKCIHNRYVHINQPAAVDTLEEDRNVNPCTFDILEKLTLPQLLPQQTSAVNRVLHVWLQAHLTLHQLSHVQCPLMLYLQLMASIPSLASHKISHRTTTLNLSKQMECPVMLGML